MFAIKEQAADLRLCDIDHGKMGLIQRAPRSRASQSPNPDYVGKRAHNGAAAAESFWTAAKAVQKIEFTGRVPSPRAVVIGPPQIF